ncbi:MAG TPA: ABC transporter substrate-binding protein, partial [Acidimicrobiia bacterium]|nr:ABC transporter substrate-binding protein [Acidimicrobiia bacterium]
MGRRVGAAGALLLLVGAAWPSTAVAGTPKDTVTIGAALSLTGSLSREGVLTREGYDRCAEVVNRKGGVHVGDRSYRVALRYQDDQSTPDVASRLVEQMNSSGVKLLLGPYGSASTEASAAVVERNGQVMVEGAGADDKIFAKGYRRIFAVLSPASRYLASIVQAAVELGEEKPKRVAIISADDGFSKTAAEGGRAEARRQGLEVVGVEYVPNGTTDVSGALTKLRPLRPDLILGSVHLQEGIAIVKQSKELGLSPAGGFGETVAPATPDFVRTLGKAAEGVLGSAQWTPDVPGHDEWFGTAADYAAGFKARYGRDAVYHNAEASAACLAMVMAIDRADSLEPDKVRDALAALDAETFFGPLRFDPTGKNTVKPMYVIQIQDGKVVTVWPRGLLTQPLRPVASSSGGGGGTSPAARFGQSTVYGLLQGGLYGLVGVGFSLVWGVTNIVNLSHGALVVGGAYIAWELSATFGLDPLLGMMVAALVLFLLGYAVQRFLINLVMNAPISMTLLLTFGLELVAVNALVATLTGDYRSIPTGYAAEGFAVGGVRVPYGRLVGFGLAVVLTAALSVFLGRTRTGRAIRATGMDRGAARLMGIPVAHIYAVTFGLAAALAGAAGAVIGTVTTFSPAAAGGFTLRSFVVAVLGGLGNMWGALAGGILLGVVEAWGGQYRSGTLIPAIAFIVLVAVL